MSPLRSQQNAIRRFGPAAGFAHRFARFGSAFRVLLVLFTVATLGAGLWLLFVIGFVLPTQDPSHIRLWTWVSVAFFAYSGLTLLYLFLGERKTWLRVPLTVASLAAVAAGVYGVTNMISVVRHGGHFEGYIVLMGLVVAGHGLCALVYTVLVRGLARMVAAA